MNSKGLLIILDGWGHGESTEHNAITAAATPSFDYLIQHYPSTLINASGEAVGLAEGTPGNSEVGHMTIGAGRVVDYESTRVLKAMRSGELQTDPALISILQQIKQKNCAVHLLGLLTKGNVHAHMDYFQPLVEAAKEQGVAKVYLHLITDGRDSPSGTGMVFIQELQEFLNKVKVGEIASVVGRDYAMDRNGKWEKTESVYRLLTQGVGNVFPQPDQAIKSAYDEGIADDYIPPSVIYQQDVAAGRVQDGDLLLAVNFRGDRMRQILRPFVLESFNAFQRQVEPQVQVLTLTDYHMDPPVSSILKHQPIHNGLAETLERHGVGNVRISETEKYPHVTFFIDGREERQDTYCSSVHIPSPQVKDYRETPKMSAMLVSQAVQEELKKREAQLIIANIVNADILGHTGDLSVVKQAVEAADQALGGILDSVLDQGYWAIICGDHGNAEVLWDKDLGKPHVGHTTNRVPFILMHLDHQLKLKNYGSLADIAPTLLELLGIPKPTEMTGKSMIQA